MRTGTSVKAGAAFLAGVLVALGGALVYFKTTDRHVKPAIQVTAIEDGGSSVPDLSKPPDAPVESTTPAPATNAAKPQPQPVPSIVKAKPEFAKPRVTSRPVSLAVWHPKDQPKQEPLVAQDLPAPSPSPSLETPAPPVEEAPQTPQFPAPPPQPHTVTIPAGTSVAVRLNERLSTEHSYAGDAFRATLETPIIMNGFIIADKGAKVLGKIVKAQKPGKFEGMAELSLTLSEITTTDGQRMHVETNESLRKGPSNTNEEVLKMGGGAALGAIIGALAGGGKGAAIGAGAGGAAGTGAVLLGHGKPAVIESETQLNFALATPVTITEQLN